MHEITPEFYMSKYGIAERLLAGPAAEVLRNGSASTSPITSSRSTSRFRICSSAADCPASKSTVVMNAADEARFQPDPAAPAARTAGELGTFVMMYHGTLTRIYGLDIAIEAFAMAHDEMPAAELWILGFGPGEDSAGGAGAATRAGLEGQAARAGPVDRDSRLAAPVRRRDPADAARRLPRLRVSQQAVGVHHHGQARRSCPA